MCCAGLRSADTAMSTRLQPSRSTRQWTPSVLALKVPPRCTWPVHHPPASFYRYPTPCRTVWEPQESLRRYHTTREDLSIWIKTKSRLEAASSQEACFYYYYGHYSTLIWTMLTHEHTRRSKQITQIFFLFNSAFAKFCSWRSVHHYKRCLRSHCVFCLVCGDFI